MNERDFKGVWIPKDLWLSSDLTLQEKVLLVEIDSLSKTDRGCFASNEYFADFLGLSKERARKIIASLIAKGYVTSRIEYKDGTKEIARRCLFATIPYGRILPHPMGETDQENNTERLIKKEIDTLVFDETSFNRFWKAYPKKKDKANAEKAFRKVKVPVSVLLDAIKRQSASEEWKKDNGKYIPYPSTWLNGKRWEDETDKPKAADDGRKRLV